MKRLLLIAGLSMFSTAALPHAALEGWEYDPECCSQKDCAMVEDSVIREVNGGYQVTILPGQHKMIPVGAEPVTRFIPHGDRRIRVSGDGDKHACLTGGGYIFCIYLPPGGV